MARGWSLSQKIDRRKPARRKLADPTFFVLQDLGAGRATALFNLCNAALGSGVLGFSAAYQSGGWLFTSIFIATGIPIHMPHTYPIPASGNTRFATGHLTGHSFKICKYV